MAIQSNYLTMQKQIADELGNKLSLLTPLADSGLALSPIQNAIQSAIAKWEREPFYFNRFRIDTPLTPVLGAPTTSPGQEFLGATTAPVAWPDMPTFAYIQKLWVLISSNRYTLNPRTPQYLDDISVNPAVVSQPVDYAYDTEQLRFYPIPDGTYPIGIWAIQRFAALEADADSNAWTNEAFDLIKSEAKLILGRDVLHDQELEQSAYRAIYGSPGVRGDRGYLFALKGETSRREGNSRIKPMHF